MLQEVGLREERPALGECGEFINHVPSTVTAATERNHEPTASYATPDETLGCITLRFVS